MVAATKSVIEFQPWQQRFFADKARIKIGCWHRQAGKDFAAAAEAVDDALATGSAWYIISITQRQADETFAKARKVGAAMKTLAKKAGSITLSEREFVDYDATLNEAFRCTARTLHLPGGGSVTALPGRDPDTLAGLTGNIILTEFGLFPNGGYAHWRVLFPLITRGFRVIAISTPRGRNTKYFELVSDPATYSLHFQTIEDSVREGFVLRDNKGRPCTLDEFKKLYADEAGWRREYMCEFSGDLEALITWAKLMAAAEDYSPPPLILRIEGDAGWQGNKFADINGQIEWGWDVARRNDLSVLWGNRFSGGKRRLACLAVMRNVGFALQREIVKTAMEKHPASTGCGDATGLGMDANEFLHTKFGDRWQPVTFTAQTKAELGSLARTAFDDGDQIIPPLEGGTKFIGADIYAVQADRTGERLKLVETENPLLPESHCDLFYAFALARKAAGIKAATPNLWVA